MTYNNGICGDLLDAIPVNQYFPWVSSGVGAGEAIFGLAYVFNSMLMTFWIYQQRRNAQRGIDGAAMYVIFPIYIPFMIMSVISDLSVGVITFFYPITYDSPNPWPLAIAAAFVYGLQHFVLEGIAFTMMQYGCGYQAARKAAICSLIWSFMTFLDQLVVSRRGIVNTEAFAIDSVWNMTLFFFYLALWIVPEKYLFRRPSVIFYSQFWCLFRCLYIAADILQTYFMNQTNGAGFCIFAFGNMLLFAACKPYVIYSTLLSDSSWWQVRFLTHKALHYTLLIILMCNRFVRVLDITSNQCHQRNRMRTTMILAFLTKTQQGEPGDIEAINNCAIL